MIERLEAMVRKFEGLRLRVYRCPAGILTIGYGHTGSDVTENQICTKAWAELILHNDAQACLNSVQSLCPGLTEGKAIALADFVYNLGVTRLAGSTLRRKVNSRDPFAADELEKWVYCAGCKLPGLIVRRHVEKMMFIGE